MPTRSVFTGGKSEKQFVSEFHLSWHNLMTNYSCNWSKTEKQPMFLVQLAFAIAVATGLKFEKQFMSEFPVC